LVIQEFPNLGGVHPVGVALVHLAEKVADLVRGKGRRNELQLLTSLLKGSNAYTCFVRRLISVLRKVDGSITLPFNKESFLNCLAYLYSVLIPARDSSLIVFNVFYQRQVVNVIRHELDVLASEESEIILRKLELKF